MSNSISSKKKKAQTRNVKLADGTVVKTNDNMKGHIKKGKISKHDIPKKKFSTETGKSNDDWEVEDDLDSHEYPPPSNHPLFRKFWAENIDNLTDRDNFNPGHLGLYEALCRLRVELRALDDFIMANGHTYRTMNALGENRKTYPEVNERMKVLSQIAQYSRLLDLVPKKDKAKGAKNKKKDENEWAEDE